MSTRFMTMVSTVSRLDRLIRKKKMDGMRDLGLKSSHTLILYLLQGNPQGLTFGELTDLSHSDAGLLSRTLKDLVSKGYVVKDGEEGRYKALYTLSRQGNDLALQIVRRIEQAEAFVRQGISDQDMELFYSIAGRLADNMEQLPEIWRKENDS